MKNNRKVILYLLFLSAVLIPESSFLYKLGPIHYGLRALMVLAEAAAVLLILRGLWKQLKSKRRAAVSGLIESPAVFFLYIAVLLFTSLLNRVPELYQYRLLIRSVLYFSLFLWFWNTDRELFGSCLLWFIFGLLLANTVSVLLFPDGLYTQKVNWNDEKQWLLGHKNTGNLYVVLMYLIAGLKYWCREETDRTPGKRMLFGLILAAGLGASVSVRGLSSVIMQLVFMAFLLLYPLLHGHERPLLLLAFLVYFLLEFLFLFRPPNRVAELFTGGLARKGNGFNGRFRIWRQMGLLIAEKPLFGHGCLSYGMHQRMLGSDYFTTAHNMLFEILLTGGALLAAVFALVIRGVMRAIRTLRGTRRGYLLLGILIMLLINGLFEAAVDSILLLFTVFLIIDAGRDDRKKEAVSE